MTGSTVAFAALRIAPASLSGASGLIEIELAGGGRVRVERDFEADALRRVIAVLEGLA